MSTRPPTGRQAWCFALAAILLGAFMVAVSLDYVHFVQPRRPRSVTTFPAPPWILSCAGLSFVYAGCSILLQHYRQMLAANLAGALAGLGIFTCLAWSAWAWH